MIGILSRGYKLFIFIVGLVLLTIPATVSAMTVRVAVSDNNITTEISKIFPNIEAKRLIYRQDCPAFDAFSPTNVGRIGVEIVLICNAVFSIDNYEKIEIVSRGGNARMINEVASGRADILGGTIFVEGLRNVIGQIQPLKSDPVLESGTFEKLVCSLPSRPEVLAVRNLSDLRKFKGVTVGSWQVDKKTLAGLSQQAVIEAPKLTNIETLIAKKRGDYTILNPSQLVSNWGSKFTCIQGIKVGLISDRIAIFSPDRADLVTAFNTYLGNLKKNQTDLFQHVFEEAGFFTKELKDSWRIYP